ncbi:hypothetical protein HN873_029730, partial [Arachis hypogaea]
MMSNSGSRSGFGQQCDDQRRRRDQRKRWFSKHSVACVLQRESLHVRHVYAKEGKGPLYLVLRLIVKIGKEYIVSAFCLNQRRKKKTHEVEQACEG